MTYHKWYKSLMALFSVVGVITLIASSLLTDVTRAETTARIFDSLGSTTRISVSDSGVQANGDSIRTDISSDGRYVVYSSTASNLVANDTNSKSDVFLYDRVTQKVTLVSKDSNSVQGNGDSTEPSISATGRYVVFKSNAPNFLGSEDPTANDNIFLKDTQSNTLTLVSVGKNSETANGNSSGPAVSQDGKYVVFDSTASNLVETDSNAAIADVFIRDMQSGTTNILSVSTGGEQSNASSYYPEITPDGRLVAFVSRASNLVVGDTDPSWGDVFLHDTQSHQTTMLSIAPDGVSQLGEPMKPSLSDDGRYVTFATTKVFWLRDTLLSKTTMLPINNVGGEYYPTSSVSPDGRYIAHVATTSRNRRGEVVVYDQQSGDYNRITIPPGQGDTFDPVISENGHFVTFFSRASTIVPNDTNSKSDVFIHNVIWPANSTFSLSGRVTDAAGTGIANARITNGLGEYVSAVDGTYTISGLSTGTYTITATLPGTNKKLVPSSRTVTVGPNATGVNFTEQVPIILVPGTGASMNMLCFFVSDDLCFNTWVTRLTWHWAPHPLIGKQVAGIYYEPLLEALRARGYTESSGYLEVFHYDWRKPAAANGQLLDQRIKDVLSNTGASRVDLITHSQGGLVARTYIQGPTYDNTVRNVFFAGVPHQGVTKSYYFWEGGQVVAGDSRMQNEVLQLLINQVYKEDLENQTTMFRRVFPSFQGMLPTYNYLRRNNELVQNNTLVWQNTTLPALNDTSGLLFGRTTVYNFVGTGIQTRQLLTLGDANPSLSTWPDGQVIGENLDKLGDGTVTQKSATLDMVDRQIEVASTHSNILLNSTTQSVIFGVLGLPVPQVEVHTAATTKAQETNFLYVAISGTVDITVTNTLGQYVGKTTTTIPDAVYVQSAGYPRQMVLVPHSTGTYTVTVGAESAGTPYSLGVLISAAAEQYTGTFFDAWDTEQAVYTPSQQFVITHDGTTIDMAVPHTSTQSVYLPLIKR